MGEFIEDAGWFWDHAEERYKIAHDYIFVNYVCTNGKHYPLDFRRFQKADLCASREMEFMSNPNYWRELNKALYLGRIPAREVGLDQTRRRSIDADTMEQWLSARKKESGV